MSAPKDFVAEAHEILDALSRDLLTLDEQRDQEPDPELVNGIFRSAHSLKGLAGMFGLERIAKLAHRAEDLLDRLRLGKVSLSPEVLDGLVESLDVFQALLVEASKDEDSTYLTDRVATLTARLGELGGEVEKHSEDPLDWIDLPSSVRNVFTEYEEHRLRENVRRGVSLFKIRAAFDLSDFDVGLAELNARLKPIGEVVSTLPSNEPGALDSIAFDLVFGSRVGEPEVAAALAGSKAVFEAIARKGGPPVVVAPPPPPKASDVGSEPTPVKKKKRKKTRADGSVEEVSEPLATPLPVPQLPDPWAGAPTEELPLPSEEELDALPAVLELRPGEPPPKRELDASLRSLTQTVRVDIGRLDALMNAVGELLLIKANLQRLAVTARQGGPKVQSKLFGQEIAHETRALERKLDELQKGILDVRMVPLGQVFDKLARLVRRIARERGKEIDFEISGGEVELDKLIVEELSDPLMHIIRNSIDHGIESPEERVALGKNRRGLIHLRAAPRGNHVVVEMRDDGAGIDEERVKQVAIERGVISADQARELGRRELQNLIFLPGFSTAAAVSELSGRGVGLDVVKHNIANLSGIIDLTTEKGRGTTFSITLPITLAIIRALVVQASGRTYAVPLSSVLEIISVPTEDIRTVERREVVNLRGQTLPFVRLSRLFGLPEKTLKRHYMVVVGLAQERMGIAVDELLGQQDVVTKSLGGRLTQIRGISGATDLGNRRTVLVLDVGALMEEVIAPERKAVEG